MINRVLLRIKIIQILYSYFKNENQSLADAQKELLISIEKAYELYFFLFLLVEDITLYAKDHIDRRKRKLTASEDDKNPSTKFIDNKFAEQLSSNKQLIEFVEKNHLSWHEHEELIKKLYQDIINSDLYSSYMQNPERSYKEDKDLWRMIFKKIFAESELLGKELEEISIYWNDDAETVISFIIKTIKQFEEEQGADQPLLPMFRDEEDREYAQELFQNAIYNQSEYKQMITECSKNWEMDRLAFMDMVIMVAALAEIHAFPSIPVNVTMNEYIEISKYYSTPKSSVFINGILDSIIDKLRKDNKIIKVGYYTSNTK
jgi:N utilization substance protein B